MQYEIKGAPFPVVICRIEPNETVCCQRGAMAWMSPNMQMSTNAGGGLGKMFSRAVSGESIFQNKYTALGGAGEIAFSVSVPGNILPYGDIRVKDYRRAEIGVPCFKPLGRAEHFLPEKIGAGFFGGEGFIMQKLSGNGIVFLEIDGSVIEYDLSANESMLVDTGYLAAMDATCSIDIESVKGIGNALFGGEGLFNTRISGPGHVWLQTMPISSLAGSIRPYIPSGN